MKHRRGISESKHTLHLTQNPNMKIFVWLQYLKTVPHISVLNFFTFWWSSQPARFRWLVFSRVFFSLLSPKTLFCHPISTDTHSECMRKVCGFFFSFSFSILLPSYPEDPSTEISTFQNKERSITNPEDATSSRQNLKFYRIITKQSYKIKVMTQSDPRDGIFTNGKQSYKQWQTKSQKDRIFSINQC